MPVPVSQMWTVASYVIKQRLAGRKQYPLVLMLEPLFRCNLACAGCGKIQYPAHILKKQLSPEQCFKAVDECGAPMVSIPGGEPLLHPQIKEIVEGLIARKKYIYLCTNALLLKEKIDLFTPSKYLTFSIHMDGEKEHHDFSRENLFIPPSSCGNIMSRTTVVAPRSRIPRASRPTRSLGHGHRPYVARVSRL